MLWTDMKVGGKVFFLLFKLGGLRMPCIGSEWLIAANKRFALSLTGWL